MGEGKVRLLAEQAVVAGWRGGRLPRAVDRQIKEAARAYRFPEWVFQNVVGWRRSIRLRLALGGVAVVIVVSAMVLVFAHLVDPASRWLILTSLLPLGPVVAGHLIGANWDADVRPRILRFEQRGMVDAFRFLVSGAAEELVTERFGGTKRTGDGGTSV